MALQYVEIRYRFLFLVISFFKSLQVVFIAIISQQMINWISRPQLNQLLGLVMIAFLGLIIFWIIGVGYQKIYFTVVQKINYNIKAITGKYLIFNARPYVKVNTSFFTNDLKSIETNRVEAELQILTNGIQFGTAVISAIMKTSRKVGRRVTVDILRLLRKRKCLRLLPDYIIQKVISGNVSKYQPIKWK